MLTIRQATENDLDLLLKWRMEVLSHVFSLPPDRAVEDLYAANLAYYKRALPRGEHIAAFAETEHGIVGCGGVCLYREMPSPDNPSGWCAYLMNIYTRKEFRGQGIGSAVVRWLIEQAERREITKIYLEASETGRPLYERLGFTDMRDYMKLQGRSHHERTL